MSQANRDTSLYRRKAKALRAEGNPCWLCSEPIDYRLEHPHPMSFTADHVNALANGGDLLGELAAAHKVCNERRGAGVAKGEVPKPGARTPVRSRKW